MSVQHTERAGKHPGALIAGRERTALFLWNVKGTRCHASACGVSRQSDKILAQTAIPWENQSTVTDSKRDCFALHNFTKFVGQTITCAKDHISNQTIDTHVGPIGFTCKHEI
ncbi:hypothetical protein EVAR_80122_1 [Eumeta japonica]|uniref:Uncharacterized protein n=1 Tax=Eumeta variegata TaxID=151549 RepID=A0A4C1UD40_EUMVA|nr:hypothetical protein EVAR_80122_1 [Eumeta japonica]